MMEVLAQKVFEIPMVKLVIMQNASFHLNDITGLLNINATAANDEMYFNLICCFSDYWITWHTVT